MGKTVLHRWPMLAALVLVMGCGTAAEPINTVCPLLGEPIDKKFTADWNGKQVAFCCGTCLAKWKNLSETAKTEKMKVPQSESKDGKSDESGDPHDKQKISTS